MHTHPTIGLTQLKSIKKGGQVCLSLPNLDSDTNAQIMARWAHHPGSIEDCTCPVGPLFNCCDCFKMNRTSFVVDYNEDQNIVCWKNLTEDMYNSQFFLFTESTNNCNSTSQRYLAGAKVNSAIVSHSFAVTVSIVCIAVFISVFLTSLS